MRAGEVPAGAGHGAVAGRWRPTARCRAISSIAEFAAVASDLFGERMPDQRSSGLRRP